MKLNKKTLKDTMKIIEIESVYKPQNSKKKLLVFHLVDNALVGVRILNKNKTEGSIVLNIDKLRKALK